MKRSKHGKKEPTLDDLIAEEVAKQLIAYEGTRVWYGGDVIIKPTQDEH